MTNGDAEEQEVDGSGPGKGYAWERCLSGARGDPPAPVT